MISEIRGKKSYGMLDLYEELKILVAELEERKIDYALCGGLALAVHGIPRATVDIDILIPKILLNNVQRLAMELGYTQIAEPMIFARGAIEIHRISKIDPDTRDLLSLDLLLVTPQVETIWSSRQEVGWEKGKFSPFNTSKSYSHFLQANEHWVFSEISLPRGR